MAACGHFGRPKFTFDRISGHFRSIRNCFFRRPFWMFENYFRSHFWPFWIFEDHFRLHFCTFQINTELLIFFIFLTKRPPAATLDVYENHFRSHFWLFQIDAELIIFLEIFNKMAAGGHFGWNDDVNYRTPPKYLDE